MGLWCQSMLLVVMVVQRVVQVLLCLLLLLHAGGPHAIGLAPKDSLCSGHAMLPSKLCKELLGMGADLHH